jgi:NAD(P)-dependent dehydrogenase (short-subunit alcohol dehydrogenase family)
MDAKGRTVVITGASRGLGAGMAEEMQRMGVKLGLCARSMPMLRGDDVVSRRVDVRDVESVRAFATEVADALGPIDLWINNAGVLDPIVFVRDLEAEALAAHLAINLIGVVHGTRAYLEHLGGRPGVLINITSGAAIRGYAGWGAYCASKAAVDRLTESVAQEEPALRAYAVAPGVIDTDMQALIRRQTPAQFPMVDKFIAMKKDDAFNTPPYVARALCDIAFDPDHRSEVVLRLPAEKP